MLTPADAEALIGRHIAPLPIESLPLAQCAGAILRENVYAERDAPPFDRVMMDGVACASEAPRSGRRDFLIQATQAAGEPPLALDHPANCIEVMTGAVLPSGCDAVIPIEQLTTHAGRARAAASLSVEPFQFVHRRASDCRQGALLLASGSRLGAPEIAIAASAGMPRVRVSEQPRVAVISTGNELVEPGEPIAPHQIRRSNAYGIVASLSQHGLSRVADDHVIDDEDALLRRLRFNLDTHDAVILSGGVSMGRFDLVPKVLAMLGVTQVFHNVAQRPGKPMWFGTTAKQQAVFALPGNPVSTLVCLTRYVLPALFAAMGRGPTDAERLSLAEDVTISAPLTHFLPVRLETDDWGRNWARPCPTNGSGDFNTLAGTAGFVEIPPGPHTFPKGHVVRLYRW